MQFRTIACGGAVAAWITGMASAQMVFTAQTRTATATGPGGVTQQSSAPNFDPISFNVQSPGATGGLSFAGLYSTLDGLYLSVQASAGLRANAQSKYGTANTVHNVTFHTPTNCAFGLTGNNLFGVFSLVGPGVNIQHSGVNPGWSHTGTFLAGQDYTLSLTTTGDPASDQSFTAHIDILDIQPQTQGGEFTYQGTLRQTSGQFINTPSDLMFALYPAAAGGAPIGPTLTKNNVEVKGGVFTTALDFGSVFDGTERWLEVGVRNPAGSGNFVPVLPRTRLDSTPYASFALGAKSAPWSGITGVPANVSGAFSPWTSVSGGINYVNSVSIGTPAFAPADQLHLMSATSNRITIQSTGTGYAGIRSKTAGREYFFGNNNNDQWELFDNTGLASRIRVLSSGNVGIGNLSPELKLSVAGGIQLPTGNFLAFGTVGNLTGTAENTDLIAFYRTNLSTGGSNSTELRLVIGDDNTAGPSQDYFTIGTIPGGAWNPTISFRSDGVAAKPGGGSWANISDPRTKHDVSPLKGTLDRLLALRGYQYFYNEDEIRNGRALPGVQIGLMADEVERVFPDWVTRDRDGMRMVTERSTTALMVEALRDLRAEKDEQIRQRDARIEALEERLKRLEAAMERAAGGTAK